MPGDRSLFPRILPRWSETMSTSAPCLRRCFRGRVTSTCSKPSVARTATLRPSSRLRAMPPGVCTPWTRCKAHGMQADVPRDRLIEQLRTLGVAPGQVLLVHASFGALRPVEGGPRGVIDALLAVLGPRGTLVMPSWTGRDDVPFDAPATPAAEDLGVLADTFWRIPGTRRSAHPFAFAARGARAEEVVAGPLPLPPHAAGSPVDQV